MTFTEDQKLMMVMVMMMMSCFSGRVGRRKALSLISSQGQCHKFSLAHISDVPQAGFEPALQCSGFVQFSSALVQALLNGVKQ